MTVNHEEIIGHVIINRNADLMPMCDFGNCCNGVDMDSNVNGCGDIARGDSDSHERQLYQMVTDGVWVWISYPEDDDYEDNMAWDEIEGEPYLSVDLSWIEQNSERIEAYRSTLPTLEEHRTTCSYCE